MVKHLAIRQRDLSNDSMVAIHVPDQSFHRLAERQFTVLRPGAERLSHLWAVYR
jgi:hypothetical protein